jgi:hypothetical protein
MGERLQTAFDGSILLMWKRGNEEVIRIRDDLMWSCETEDLLSIS